jgi:adenylate cyclase
MCAWALRRSGEPGPIARASRGAGVLKPGTFEANLVRLGFVSERQLSEAHDDARASGLDVTETLLARGLCTREQLHAALAGSADSQNTNTPRLGDVLIALDYISEAKLAEVLAAQATDRRPLGALLVDKGMCTFEQVYEGLLAQSRTTNQRARVIVVDDSPLVLQIVTEELVDLGYDVVPLDDPREVLAQLDQLKPDIVITDLEMPGLDGAELCRQLKIRSNNELPVIILTGNESEEAVTGLRAGADDYVRKGASMEELGARIDGILRRAKATFRVRNMFARYTSDAVVEQVLKTGDAVVSGEKRDVTILFADIRDFTAFSELHAPEVVISALNEILGRLADAVIAQRGTVDKFLGDGLMAVFGAPVHLDDHAERALAAGLQMLDALRGHPLAIGIAINSGLVVAGSIGNERRTEYTCIGDTVNTAARLCAMAEPSELLVGEGTLARVDRHDRFEAMPPVKLKGKSQPVRLSRAKR